ncbi:MAG TPA: PspC domain-containing protein [Thermomicrobiales bacterium]|nr:PspC domain-containing protein [Thermomicrobiales bacterium]
MFNIGLYRSRKHKVIFGVCGGIADQFGVSPFWVRIATVIGAIVIPGISIWPIVALYIALGLALPVREDTYI